MSSKCFFIGICFFFMMIISLFFIVYLSIVGNSNVIQTLLSFFISSCFSHSSSLCILLLRFISLIRLLFYLNQLISLFNPEICYVWRINKAWLIILLKLPVQANLQRKATILCYF